MASVTGSASLDVDEAEAGCCGGARGTAFTELGLNGLLFGSVRDASDVDGTAAVEADAVVR